MCRLNYPDLQSRSSMQNNTPIIIRGGEKGSAPLEWHVPAMGQKAVQDSDGTDFMWKEA